MNTILLKILLQMEHNDLKLHFVLFVVLVGLLLALFLKIFGKHFAHFVKDGEFFNIEMLIESH